MSEKKTRLTLLEAIELLSDATAVTIDSSEVLYPCVIDDESEPHFLELESMHARGGTFRFPTDINQNPEVSEDGALLLYRTLEEPPYRIHLLHVRHAGLPRNE